MPILERASNLVINNSLLVDASRRGLDNGESWCPACGSWLCADDDDEGWKSLTQASLFNATYDSAAQAKRSRHLPHTRCESLVKELGDLISGSGPLPYALVFSGPRSNLTHLCAKRLEDNSCASFFVSHSLKTDNDLHFFPTIAYQLSRKIPAYSRLLLKELRHDPSILDKTLEVQFQKLIADPFRKLLETEELDFGERKVIVIDGLEEYAEFQTRLDILRIILSGAGRLPFIWLIFCRPDSALDKEVDEMVSTVRTPWGDGYPTLQTTRYSTGSVHGFLLLHSSHRLMDFESKNIVMAISFFFFSL